MADKRQKRGSISLRFRGKSRVFDVYDAEMWPDQQEADLGLYRLCECEYVGKKKVQRWLCLGGKKYTFFTPQALSDLLVRELTAPGWLDALQRTAPKLSKGDWVRWYGPHYSTRLFRLGNDPFLWIDGQWRVLISDLRLGRQMVCCDELVPVDRLGREVER